MSYFIPKSNTTLCFRVALCFLSLSVLCFIYILIEISVLIVCLDISKFYIYLIDEMYNINKAALPYLFSQGSQQPNRSSKKTDYYRYCMLAHYSHLYLEVHTHTNTQTTLQLRFCWMSCSSLFLLNFIWVWPGRTPDPPLQISLDPHSGGPLLYC